MCNNLGDPVMKDNIRPGISNKTLVASGIRHVDDEEAYIKTGMRKSGILFPYFDLNGHPIIDKVGEYCRLRLDEPIGSQKYHQRGGSGVHIYIPPGFTMQFAAVLAYIIIIEGEAKALSLFEAGYPAIGLPGFYGYSTNKETREKIVIPEFEHILKRYSPKVIYFLGDNDTCLNYRFSIAAVRLAELVAPVPVLLPRLPLDGPKGIDDLREEMP